MAYEYFGGGMMNGSYGFGWMHFSWIIGILTIMGLILFIIWITKKIQEENSINKRRKK